MRKQKKQNFMAELKGGVRVFVDGVSPDEEFITFRIVGKRGGGLYNDALEKKDLNALRSLFELAVLASEVPRPDFPEPERY